MAVQYELSRIDLTSLGAGVGTTLLEPKSGTAFLRRKGATVTIAGSVGGPGAATVTVSDVGSIVPGDTVQVNAAGTTGTVNSIPYTRTTLNITWAAAVSWVVGDRLVLVTPNVDTFIDPYGVTSVPQPLAFGSASGLMSVYTRVLEVDVIRTIGATIDIITDQAGLGGRISASPLDFDAKFDDSTDDATAFANMLTVAQTRGRGIIELPAGVTRLGANVSFTDITSLTIRGQGKNVTELRFTGAAVGLIIDNCIDVVFENMTIGRTLAGSVALTTVQADCTRTGFRNVHFNRGWGVCLDQGVDTFFENCSADGADWVTGMLFLNAVRPKVLGSFVARVANNMTNPFIDIDQDTRSPRFENLDVQPSSLATFTILPVRVRNSDGTASAPGPTNVIFDAPHLVGGNAAGPGAKACVEILANAGTGDDPIGTVFNNILCEDSERAIDMQGGVGTRVDGIQSIGMDEECIYVKAGASHVRLNDIESSHIGISKAHVRIDGAASDVRVAGAHGGNHLRSAAGNTGASVVSIEDGVGQRIVATMVSHDKSTVDQGVVNSKTSARSEVHVFHNIRSGSAPASPVHEGFGFQARNYTNDDTTPSVESVGLIQLSYGAGITITDFDEGSLGQIIFVTNTGANTITIAHAASLITTITGAALALLVDETVMFYLSPKATKRWVQIVAANTN